MLESDAYMLGLIQAVVSRCTVATLQDVLIRWDRIERDELMGPHLKGTKAKICSVLQKIAKRDNLNKEIVADLELAYMQLNSSKKFWKVFKLKGNNVKLNLDPRSLRSRLVRNLQEKKSNGAVDGNMSTYAGALWVRVHLSSQLRRRPVYEHKNSVFIVTYPGTRVVAMSHSTVTNSRMILQALKEVMGAESVVDAKLSGHHLPSLADLALNTQKQPGNKYRRLEAEENPKVLKAGTKRKAPSPEPEDIPGITDHTAREKRHRGEVITKVFGAGPQPTLDSLCYQFDVKPPNRSNNQATDDTSDSHRFVVEIKGKDALGGLVALAKKGMVRFPMAKHLSSVVGLRQNSFNIRNKA